MSCRSKENGKLKIILQQKNKIIKRTKRKEKSSMSRKMKKRGFVARTHTDTHTHAYTVKVESNEN